MPKRPYTPLDIHDTNLKRVRGPAPEYADPNNPDEAPKWWDFDLRRRESARFGVRPIAVLSILGAIGTGLSGLILVGIGTLTVLALAPQAEGAPPVSGMRMLAGGVLSLCQSGLFAYIATGSLMKARLAPLYGILALVILITTQITALMGIHGGIGIGSVLFTLAYALAIPIAVEATSNLHRMNALGVDELPPEDDGND